jgi:hypothetical protein
MMSARGVATTAVMVGLFLAVAQEAGATSSLPDDFSATLNPNGEWSWGYSNVLGSFTPLPFMDNADWRLVYPTWYTSLDGSYPSGPHVWKNMTANTWLHNVAPGQVSLHPGNDDRMAIVRWTSPLQTELSIVGQFWAGDLGEVDVFVLETTAGGTTTLFSVLGTPSSQSFSLTTSVKAGDAIDFVVGRHDGWFYDNTPLNVDITPIPTPIPEPLTMLGLALSMGSIGVYLRKRGLKWSSRRAAVETPGAESEISGSVSPRFLTRRQ